MLLKPGKVVDLNRAKPQIGLEQTRSGSKVVFAAIGIVTTLGLLFGNHPTSKTFFRDWTWSHNIADENAIGDAKIVRKYDLQIGTRWMNPDGGRWRPMYVCNGQSPCPTLFAEEGDIVEVSFTSDSYFQTSIHWAGVGYDHTGAWNDGTAGISQFPTLPRGNHTFTRDTSGAWGLGWYSDHTTAAAVDGLYGMVYVAPSRDRPRPYSLISDDPVELKQIMEAEREIHHLAIKNHQHRDTSWKLLRMRAEGSEFHCYNSILVNGKGRNLCRPQGYEQLNGHDLDETGCIQPPGFGGEKCNPSESDFEVIETRGRRYIMMNLINIGFEHEVQVAVDNHKIAIVANDGGFVKPEMGDAVYVPSAGRVTVLIKLDQPAGDYSMRIASVSQLQNLQSFAILRYPAKRRPVYGEPMKLPPFDPNNICLNPDGSISEHCKGINPTFSAPFPSQPPPRATNKKSYFRGRSAPGRADFTFRLTANSQASKTEKSAPEYLLNEKPWPLFRGSLTPLLFTNLSDPDAQKMLEKPVIHGLPMGSIVDLIIENKLNDSIPLYKHGNPGWLLGANAFDNFTYATVEEALDESSGGDGADCITEHLNLDDPGLVIVHDLPPLGWSVLRFRVSAQAATMIHAVKLRYFLLGMSAPILEGVTVDDPISFPETAVQSPHVPFEPKNDGIFG